jgi:hypothetical protein
MTARIWRGATAQRDAEDYVGYLRETGLKGSWQGSGPSGREALTFVGARPVGRCIE